MTIHSPQIRRAVRPLSTRLPDDPHARVVLPERFDCHRIDALIDAPTHGDLVVDASRVRFADEAALAALVEARLDRLSVGADLVLVLSDALRVILELTGDDVLLGTADADTSLMAEAA
ncbi:MAG: hypothetical protein OES57_11270 [Acidimicrobiia bacterium]|nr:hypothetical protein [Acidimicrobiia bacterium]